MARRPPSPESPSHRIAVIGDGHAAAALLLQLDERGTDPRRIHLYGPGHAPERGGAGGGNAYGTENPCYRLNVRSGLMSVHPGDEEGFHRWAEAGIADEAAETDAGLFYRRGDFARFTKELLGRCPGAKGWQRSGNAVVRLQHDPQEKGQGDWRLTLDDGEVHRAGLVVLATGNPAPVVPFKLDPAASHLLESALWRGEWQQALTGDEAVAIVGGGLTAMDALLALHHGQHRGPIQVIAPFHTGGRALPPRQADWREAWEINAKPVPTAGALLGVFRRTLPKVDWETAEWQSAFEGLREWLPPCWRSMPRGERLRAARWLSGFWQPARYRASPQTVEAAEALRDRGQLTLSADRVTAMTLDGSSAKLGLVSGGSVSADRVLMATGAGADPLAASMKEDGLIPTEMVGLEVDTGFRVLDRRWHGQPGLYAFGPPTALARGDVVGATTTAKEASALADYLTKERN